MNTRSEQKNLTHKKIIETAYKLFSINGFINVSTLEIAKSAHIAHGSLFSHFPTRDALIIAVIEYFGNEISKKLHDISISENSLEKVLYAHLECIKEHESFYTKLIREISIIPNEARNMVLNFQSIISHHIYSVAETEIRLNRIKNIENDLLFNTWMGLLHYYLQNRESFITNDSVIGKHGQRLLKHFLILISK